MVYLFVMKIPEGLHRVFLALPISQNYFKALYDVQCSLKSYLPDDMAWTPLRNMHITLFFFGEVTLKRLEQLITQVPEEIIHHIKQKINISHISTFGPVRNPRVLYLYDENLPESITELASLLYTHFASANDRSFTAHLTIAKFPNHDFSSYMTNVNLLANQSIRKTSEFDSIEIDFDRIVLFESKFKGRVVSYVPLAEWNKKGLHRFSQKDT